MKFLINPWEVCYQIYPLSFCDDNNDGYGDLPGIISKLNYLKDLGIDRIWISSIWQSPMIDNGYDISDYLQINNKLGKISDFHNLITQAHQKKLKIIVDVVFNHTSVKHQWFSWSEENRAPYNDYYYWTDSPNDSLKNNLGEISYSYSDKRKSYYLHLFGKNQIDLNWHSSTLRNQLLSILQQYISWGVDGFRFDVIDMIGKVPDSKTIVNSPQLHSYLYNLAEQSYNQLENFLTVGECWSAGLTEIAQYTNKNQRELSNVFALHLFSNDFSDEYGQWKLQPFNFKKLKLDLERYQNFEHKEVIANVISNHDIPRFISRVFPTANCEQESNISKMLMAMLLTLNGIPFIYQGEEIGMTGIKNYDNFNFNDYETINRLQQLDIIKDQKLTKNDIFQGSRDNSRTMMQWDDNLINKSFWLNINKNTKIINVKNQQQDENSTFNVTKKLIALRHSQEYRWLFSYAHFTIIPFEDDKVVAYYKISEKTNNKIFVILNFTNQKQNVMLKYNKIIISNNYSSSQKTIMPYGFLIAEE